MATKKFIIEVEEGYTVCQKCPMKDCRVTTEIGGPINCDQYNLATMKIKELEES